MTETFKETMPRRLFDAIESKDIEAIRAFYAEDIQVWNNVQCQPMSHAQSLKLLELFTSRMKEIRYEVLDVREFPGGCVDRHVLRGTTLKGKTIEAHVCLILEYVDGKISKIYEYLDQANVAGVFEE